MQGRAGDSKRSPCTPQARGGRANLVELGDERRLLLQRAGARQPRQLACPGSVRARMHLADTGAIVVRHDFLDVGLIPPARP